MQPTPIQLDSTQQRVRQTFCQLAKRLEENQGVSSGIYLYGPVGRGKSMLMDGFFKSLQIKKKKRLHYHHFMRAIHTSLAELTGYANPLELIALNWAAKYRVLCVDEFMVEDIGDAMLLGTLWRHLFALGVILIATSNTKPIDLYRNGLQRDRFLPAIDLIEQHCEIIALDGGQDYRMLNQPEQLPYYQITGKDDAPLKANVEKHCGILETMSNFDLLGRSVQCLGKNEKAIVFTFEQLCTGPRSQRDYMVLAAEYTVIGVSNVPQFTYLPEREIVHGVEETYQRENQQNHASILDNEARRFIALVDECYDNHCLLMLSAATLPEQLYQAKQLAEPFARCSSRLYEMQRWII